MKLNYFGYYIYNNKTDDCYLYDLRPFLKAFCNYSNPTYKNSFEYSGEHVYLFPLMQDVFLFLQTKESEVIRKIDSSQLKVEDINTLLATNEHLGFAAYAVMKDGYFGFASTILAPKTKGFITFLNEILESVGLDHLEVVTQPLLYEATAAEVFQMPMIGRSSIEVDANSSLLAQLGVSFTGHVNKKMELDSFEIIFKPKRFKDIKKVVKDVFENIPDSDVRKFVVKGRQHLQDELTEFHIVGKGAISDYIGSKKDNSVCDEIAGRAKQNKVLAIKVAEYKNGTWSNGSPDGLDNFSKLSAWTGAVGRVSTRNHN